MALDRRTFLKLSTVAATAAATGGPLFASLKNLSAADVVAPGQGLTAERWAMTIDVPKCLASNVLERCAEACHVQHNVPDIRLANGETDPKNEVKWIWEEEFHRAFPGQSHEFLAHETSHKPVLVLCNHCDNPPCVRVCPTKATFTRPDGVVAMDQHRCIGCRFCMAACPYGSRSFNWGDPRPHIKEISQDFPTRTKGVVEKCNFCTELLAEGKPPACAEVSGGAIAFGDLHDAHSAVRRLLEERHSIRRKPELGTQPAVYYLL